jgi:4-amino-4-deoxy-L-arabinose transferase-like glycosyltransferase
MGQLAAQRTTNPLKHYLVVAISLLLLSLILRLPFFFPDVIDWDESTFILMGQSILDGHLPYTELWDNKPPLAFVCFAVFIVLFGKSIVAIRFAGALCVALVSFLIYLIGKTIWSDRIGILGATQFITISSVLPEAQAIMTEHLALVPLMGALSLLVAQKPTPLILFAAGILMAISTLIRLNLAYVVVIIGLLVVFQKPLRSSAEFLKRGLAYACGNLLVVFLTYIPYAIANYQQTWWSSVIFAPWIYANSQSKSSWDVIGLNVLCVLILIGGWLGLKLLFRRWKKISQVQQNQLTLLVVFFLATEISILKSGASYSHYIIQLYPFFGLIAALLLNTFLPSKVRLRTVITVLSILAILLSEIFTKYQIIADRALAGQPLTYGPGYEIATYLNRENVSQEPVYMMSDHIAYWLTDLKPLTKLTTHPSNISREYLLKALLGSEATTETEMAKILAQQPKFIVKKKDSWYLSDKLAARILLEETLKTQYKLVKEIQEREIYRQIELHPNY